MVREDKLEESRGSPTTPDHTLLRHRLLQLSETGTQSSWTLVVQPDHLPAAARKGDLVVSVRPTIAAGARLVLVFER